MPMPFLPWEHYPSLSEKRLITLAALLQETRDHVADLSEPEEGDTAWSVGCRVYDRTVFALHRAVSRYEWLRILPEAQRLRLTFAVGCVPLKLYKGEPEDLPTRTLVRSYSELKQMHLAFTAEGANSDVSLRVAVEADATGRTTSITLVEVDASSAPSRIYEIPLGKSNVVPLASLPIDLPAPTVELISPEMEEKGFADDRDASGTGTAP